MTMEALASRVRTAQRLLSSASGTTRTAALTELADLLAERTDAILEANEADVEAARQAGVAAPLQARLRLTPAKLDTLRTGLCMLADGGDPVGKPLRKTHLDDGLVLTQVKQEAYIADTQTPQKTETARPDDQTRLGA